MDAGDLINSLTKLTEAFDNVTSNLGDINDKLFDMAAMTEDSTKEASGLLDVYRELTKEIDKTTKDLREMNKEKKKNDGSSSQSSDNNGSGNGNSQGGGGSNNILEQIIKRYISKGNASSKSSLGSSAKSMGGTVPKGGVTAGASASGGAVAGGATPKGGGGAAALAIVDLIVKGISFAVNKATEYMVVGYENAMRAMEAITTAEVNKMTASLDLWKNSLNGIYDAQKLLVQSSESLIKAQFATDLANRKLTDSWFKGIPLIGGAVDAILNYTEVAIEKEQEFIQKEISTAQERIKMGQAIAQQTNDYVTKQNQAIRDYTRSVGLSIEQTGNFEGRMLDLGVSLASFNYTAEQVLKMQAQIQQQSGRIVNYTDEQYEKLGSIGKIMGEETATRIQSEMVIFNQSVDDSAKIMTDMYNYANTMGISQKKLSQDVVNNFKLANKYQFKNGIQGYIEFAKWAENVRFNISQLGSALEKIQTGGLEGVIKQSAQLQVLGGNIGMHSDPLRMAYQSFMDPGEMAKDIYESLRGEGAFNTQTGDIERGIASQMRVRAMAQARGLNYDDLVTMIREETKKRNVAQELKGSNFSSEQMDAIANAAQYNQETQQWYVTDLKGQTHSLQELEQTPQLLEEILSNNKDEDMLKYAQETLSLTEQIEQSTAFISAIMGRGAYENVVKTIQETTGQTIDAYSMNLDEILAGVEEINDESVKSSAEMLKNLNNFGTNIHEAFTTIQGAEKAAKRIQEIMEARYGEYLDAREKTDEATQEYFDTVEQIRQNPSSNPIDQFNANQAMISAHTNVKMKEADEAIAQGDKVLGYLKKGFWWVADKYQRVAGTEASIIPGATNWAAKHINPDNIQISREEMRKARQGSNNGSNNDSSPVGDAVATAGGVPMAVAAKSITSIQDGLASADTRDTAIFAKTGGPFDKLFNGVFGKVNAIYDKVIDSVVPAPFRPVMQFAKESLIGTSKQTQDNDNTPIKFEPLRIEMNGRLELSSGGQSVDIMNELQNNPLLIREVAKMISDSLSAKFYGGKAKVVPGQNTYFK